jgi:hypothetical protein
VPSLASTAASRCALLLSLGPPALKPRDGQTLGLELIQVLEDPPQRTAEGAGRLMPWPAGSDRRHGAGA